MNKFLVFFALLKGGLLWADWGGYFQAEFLYWSSFENGLEYAYQQNSSQDAAPSTNPLLMPVIYEGKFNRIGGDWAPGLRLEVGLHTPFDSWDFYGQWTRISSEMDQTSQVNSLRQQNLAPIWLEAGYAAGYPEVLRASSSWDLLYNVVDVACLRTYFSSPRFQIGMHTGFKGAWINQQFYAQYSGGTVIQTPTQFKGKNNFQSVGLLSQGDLIWWLSDEWKLLGRFQGAINWGRYQLDQQVLSAVDDVTSSIPYQLHNVLSETIFRTRFAYEASLGFEWQHSWGDTKLGFQAMYELTSWVHLNQLR